MQLVLKRKQFAYDGGNELEEAMRKLHSGQVRVVNVGLNAGVPTSESGYFIPPKPSALKSTKRVVKGIGRNIAGLFTGK